MPLAYLSLLPENSPVLVSRPYSALLRGIMRLLHFCCTMVWCLVSHVILLFMLAKKQKIYLPLWLGMKCLRKTSVIISHRIWTESETYGEQNAYMIGDINIKTLFIDRTKNHDIAMVGNLGAFSILIGSKLPNFPMIQV